jgi:FkbM family methyltransferase
MGYTSIIKEFVQEFLFFTRYRIRVHITKPKQMYLNGIILAIEDYYPIQAVKSIYRCRYEAAEARCVLARIDSDDVIMDFGAGIGYISILCAKSIGSERVFCYEANSQLIPTATRNFEANKVAPVLQNVMLGRENGEATFFLGAAFTSSSMVENVGATQEINVKAVDINDEIQRRKPTFLIIDIEGGEYELIPYINFEHVRKILIELHYQVIGPDKARKVRAHLTRQGFSVDSEISSKSVIYLERLDA